jgi:uncharacterized protein (TIGR02757 family)
MQNHLNRLYAQYNLREYVHPDPLEFLYHYPAPRDREIAGLVAASLAYGRVGQILKSIAAVLDPMGNSPCDFLAAARVSDMEETYARMVHRFATGAHIAALLAGVKLIINTYGSLYDCFLDGFSSSDSSILPALINFTEQLHSAATADRSGSSGAGHLIPCPAKKSACKRLHLYLRWMVRNDAVDPGGWDRIPAAKLLVPVDTHMHRIGKMLGLTRRNQADLKTAVEITEGFRKWEPDDPVKFDFTLTRFGIRSDMDIQHIFR